MREDGWRNEETSIAAGLIRKIAELRLEVEEEINSLSGGLPFDALVNEAAQVVRTTVLGRWNDAHIDPAVAPEAATLVYKHMPNVEVTDWAQLGETFLLEIATTGSLHSA